MTTTIKHYCRWCRALKPESQMRKTVTYAGGYHVIWVCRGKCEMPAPKHVKEQAS